MGRTGKKLVQNGLTEIEIVLSQTTMKTSSELELQAALHVAGLMAAAARTAIGRTGGFGTGVL